MSRIALVGATGLDWWADERKKSFIESITPNGFRIDNFVPEYGTHSVESHVDEAYNAPFILQKIIEADSEDYDAIVIDCACDPVLEAGREAVDTPVVGATNSSLHLALTLGTSFSVITVAGRSLVQCIRALVRRNGLDSFLASIRYLQLPVLDIAKKPNEVQNELSKMTSLVIEEDNADVVVLGCTGLSHNIDTKSIAKEHGVPLLDPLVIAVKTAALLVETGLSHSKVAYPTPPKKKITEAPSLKGKFDEVLKE